MGWGTTSENFYSACLPFISVQICVKFSLFSNIFLTSSMFYLERSVLHLPDFFVPFQTHSMWTVFCKVLLNCLFARWCLIKSLLKYCLNCYVAFSFEKISTTKTRFSFDIWGIVTLNLFYKRYFWIFSKHFVPRAI